jgi:hypothetical protein
VSLFKRRRFPVEIILLCVRPVLQVWDHLSGWDDATAQRQR